MTSPVTHRIGMLLGTEEDWPSALEQFLHRPDLRIRFGGRTAAAGST